MIKSETYRRVLLSVLLLIILILAVNISNRIYIYYTTDKTVGFRTQLDASFSTKRTKHIEWVERASSIIDPGFQQIISQQYSMAWEILKTNFQEHETAIFNDYFSEALIENLQFNGHKSASLWINVAHHLIPILLSEDEHLLYVRDSSALILIDNPDINNSDPSSFLTYVADIDILFVLKDGDWQIQEMNVTSFKEKSYVTHESDVNVPKINGINYYPCKNPWKSFWPNYSDSITRSDLHKIKTAGFNAIRVFIPYMQTVNTQFTSDLHSLMQVAQDEGLIVMLCLFDFPNGYSSKLFSEHAGYIKNILDPLKTSSFKFLIDIKNEADLDFDIYGVSTVLKWATAMCHFINLRYSDFPLTLGWSDGKYGMYLKNDLDFVSFHHYRSEIELSDHINSIRLSTPLEILVSEYGRPSSAPWYLPGSYSKIEQQRYNQKISAVLGETQCGGVVWTYSDFIEAPKDVFGWKPWIRHLQQSYGLWDVHGVKK